MQTLLNMGGDAALEAQRWTPFDVPGARFARGQRRLLQAFFSDLGFINSATEPYSFYNPDTRKRVDLPRRKPKESEAFSDQDELRGRLSALQGGEFLISIYTVRA